MGSLGVHQFGPNLSGHVYALQNGLTEVSPGIGELGGNLTHDTEIGNASFKLSLTQGTLSGYSALTQFNISSDTITRRGATFAAHFTSVSGNLIRFVASNGTPTVPVNKNAGEYISEIIASGYYGGSYHGLSDHPCEMVMFVDAIGADTGQSIAFTSNITAAYETPVLFIRHNNTVGVGNIGNIASTYSLASYTATLFVKGYGATSATKSFEVHNSAGTSLITVRNDGMIAVSSGSSIVDVNFNELISFPSTIANAVNNLQVSNAATGNPVGLSATGDDTNISINITPKGSGSLLANQDTDLVTILGRARIHSATSDTVMLSHFDHAGASSFGIRIQSTGATTINSVSGQTVRISVNNNNIATFSSTTITITDAVNIALDTTNGTKIGTATTQKIGFWNATPAVQPAAVADASGGATIDSEARTAINTLLARLRTIGIIST
jgi:hypothetical protein